MDRLNDYRGIVERITREYAALGGRQPKWQRVPVIDRDGDHYLLMLVGWEDRRIHGCLIHVDIIDGKFWIQRDGTEYGIARELEDAGVPRSDIVLGFKPPEIRKHTDYAVA